jgi:hypothetical protein
MEHVATPFSPNSVNIVSDSIATSITNLDTIHIHHRNKVPIERVSQPLKLDLIVEK